MQSIINKIKASLFLKNTLILFIGATIANVLNYIFNLVIGRLLTVQQFGDLIAIESIFIIIGVIGATLTTAITRQVSIYKAKNDLSSLKTFKKYFEKLFLGFGFLVFFILLIFAKPISNYLKTPLMPLIVMESSFIFVFISLLYSSILQGLQRFKVISFNGILGAIIKLAVGIGLVLAGLSTTGAVLGYVAPIIVGVFIIYLFIRDINKIKTAQNQPKIKITKNHLLILSKFFLATLCLTLLYNTDLLMVKHYFTQSEAGLYSSLAMLARIIFFGTGIIAAVLLPMATERHEKGEQHQHLFLFSILIIALVSAMLTIFYFLFPEFVITMLFGVKYLSGANLLGIMALMMSVYSILNIIIIYLISLKKFNFLIPLVLGAILQIIFISTFHASLFQIIMITLITISCVSVSSFVLVYFPKEKAKSKSYANDFNHRSDL